jgi:predicted nucleic acid-binding protein
MRVFFDASAFAKGFVEEQGCAFGRLRRERQASPAQYVLLKKQRLLDITDALIVDTSLPVLRHAVRALESHGLRGMDAIRVGAAIDCRAQGLITSDQRQAGAARAMGLEAALV